ncbi:MAG: type II secretion system protein [Campylobacterota bacterium]|nr:type II secretion system protein [Campylobacterota bacterium]
MPNRNAFTMIELVFVIVVIGILSAIAIPKFAATRDDALITRGLNTLSSVRSAIATERQKQILRGNFDGITSLRGTGSGIFTTFNDVNGSRVLEYDVKSCTSIGCWSTSDGETYTFKSTKGDCTYKLESNRFVDKTTGGCTDMQ